jgi:acyl-CoA synthetase (AMP-forming)/AMP-acid ligase II
MRAYSVTHSQWVPTMLIRLLRLGPNERGAAFPAHRVASGGVNIYPPEIEAVLFTHPDIVDASVVGEPDPEFGERVVAVVEPRPGTDPGALSEKLVQLCRERLAHFKAPRRVVMVDRLPRRPNGKLNLEGVRALVRSGKENT